MTDNELLKAFKQALYFEDCNRIMEGGISTPLEESYMFEAFKCGVVYAMAQKTAHNSDYTKCIHDGVCKLIADSGRCRGDGCEHLA